MQRRRRTYGGRWEEGGKERRPNEKLLPPSLSTTPLQSVMGRHVDTSASVHVDAWYTPSRGGVDRDTIVVDYGSVWVIVRSCDCSCRSCCVGVARLLESLHQWPGSRYPLYCANVYSQKNVKYFVFCGSTTQHTHIYTRTRARVHTGSAVSFILLPLPILSPRSQPPSLLPFPCSRISSRYFAKAKPVYVRSTEKFCSSLPPPHDLYSTLINHKRNSPDRRINGTFQRASLLFLQDCDSE